MLFAAVRAAGWRRAFSATRARIAQLVADNDVVLFMKGTPRSPMCGFSRAVCQVLERQGLTAFTAVNVLEDEDVRAEIKAFTYGPPLLSHLTRSAWPTIPQLFVKGSFLGGCDIVLEMHQNGQLRDLLLKERILAPSPVEK